MESDFSEKLKKVLSDPEAMSKITAIASSLGGNPQPVTEPAAEEPKIGDIPENPLNVLQSFSAYSDPRLELLSAVKPLLREDKRSRIDTLTRALVLAQMMKNFRK